MKTATPCPDCGERLSVDADRCGSCGWTKPGARKRGDFGPRHNMTCTWHSTGGLFCVNPCAQFIEGRTSGFCILHREKPDGGEAAAIAEESHHLSPVEFVERAKDATYGARDEHGQRQDNANLRELRARLTERARGGNVGLFSTRILGPRDEKAPDEPGSNG